MLSPMASASCLSPRFRSALVLPAIAQALGVREADRPLADQLVGLLRDRELLLVLDNLEQVLSPQDRRAARRLSSTHCPGHEPGAVTRVRERTFDVPPRALPTRAEGRRATDRPGAC